MATVLDMCGEMPSVTVMVRERTVRAYALSDFEEQRVINAVPRPVIPAGAGPDQREAMMREWASDCAACVCAASLKLSTSEGVVYGASGPGGTGSPEGLAKWVTGILLVDLLRSRLTGPEIDGINAAWRRAAGVHDAGAQAGKD